MKKEPFRSTLVLLALCAAAVLHAEVDPVAARRASGEIPVDRVTAKIAANGDTISSGTSRVMVSLRLGTPNYVTADGSWLYYNYHASFGEHETGRPGTLVVRFANDQVTSLTIASQAAVVALRAAPRPRTNPQILAAR